jgi:hypothetical protein
MAARFVAQDLENENKMLVISNALLQEQIENSIDKSIQELIEQFDSSEM